MEDTLLLKKFDCSIINKKRMSNHSPVILMVGKRGTGKSSIVLDVLEHIKDIPVVIVFSATEDSNSNFSKHVHELFIYNKFDPVTLENIVNRQKRVVKDITKKGQDPALNHDIDICIILDDLNYDPKVMKDKSITEIFLNGRHLHITLIMTFQYMMSVPPLYRTNVDFLFICKETKKDNIKRLHDYYFGMIDSLPHFAKILAFCTNDYGCLVLDSTTLSNNINEQVFWYKARLGLKYKISANNWSEYDKKLNINNNNNVEEDTSTSTNKNKKTTDLIIKKIK